MESLVEKVESREELEKIVDMLEKSPFDGNQQHRRVFMQYLSKPEGFFVFNIHALKSQGELCCLVSEANFLYLLF